jgi:sugar/nucleoside kinase (ribokinase family)
MVGTGDYANLLRAELITEQVDTHLIADETASGSQHSYVLLSGEGERTILWSPQPRATTACYDLCRELIPQARCLMLDCTDLPLVLAAGEIARAHDVPTVIDTGSYKPHADPTFALADYLIAPEKNFAARAAERGLSYHETMADIARAFGPKVVMATEGARGGVYLKKGDATFRRFEAEPTAPIDSCGAGDVFHGGFAFGVAQQWPLAKIIAFGAWLAARQCTAVGNGALPSPDQLPERFAAQPVE